MSIHFNVKFFRAICIMIGAIVGVGVFGLPYAFAQSGFAIGMIELVVIGGCLLLQQLMMAEIATQTQGSHRVVGYVKTYLGPRWAFAALIALGSGIWGAMIAYLIVGGYFLSVLFAPLGFGDQSFWLSLALAGVVSFLVYRGLAFASRFEVVVIAALFVLFLLMIASAIPDIQFAHLAAVDFSKWLLPSGVLLFALAGSGAVPEMKEVLGLRDRHRLAEAVVIAMGCLIVLYTLFTFAIVGVTGLKTTEVAFDGLASHLGKTVFFIGSLLGTLTIVSIYMLLGIEMMNTLKHDFHLKHRLAWFLTISIPVFLFIFGVRELIVLLSFVGSVCVGAFGIIIVWTYVNMKSHPVCQTQKCLSVPKWVSWLLMMFFLGLMAQEIVRIF